MRIRDYLLCLLVFLLAWLVTGYLAFCCVWIGWHILSLRNGSMLAWVLLTLPIPLTPIIWVEVWMVRKAQARDAVSS